MLLPLVELLSDARARGYAVGSFNVASLVMIDSVIVAAAQNRAPVIVSTSAAEARYLRPEVVQPAVKTLVERHGVTCALHLDHGDSPALARRCLAAGYTSLMYDGSHHPLQENIRLTREVVAVARAHGVSVEGEVGRLSGVEDDLEVAADNAHLTDIDEARRFVAETGVDCLAVAIGNAHGFTARAPRLDFERLRQIYAATGVPIVLHGGTGIPVEDVRRAIKLGIAKVNIASRVRRAYMHATYTALAPDPFTTDVRAVAAAGKTAMVDEITRCLEMLGAVGRA